MKKQMFDTIDSKLLKSFEIVKKVGQGGHGQVWKTRNKKTGGVSALKKIWDVFNSQTQAQKTYREIRYLEQMNHPNILKLLGFHGTSANQEIYLELEFMSADLCIALKNSLLKPVHKHYIFYQLANAVTYLHSAELIHRDIKPTNILVNEVCDAKLCDFGLIRAVDRDGFNQAAVMTEKVGTRWYKAPETLLRSNYYGKAGDVWSMGCVLAEMILQKPIFQGSSTVSQLQKIFEITGPPSDEDLKSFKNEAVVKMMKSLQIKQKKDIKSVLKTNDEPLLDLLGKIFQINPLKRPTASEILSHPFVAKFKGKIEEKIALKPIKILYEQRLLSIQDYKQLICGELEEIEASFGEKASQDHEEPSVNSIYKTMPTITRNALMTGVQAGKKDQMHNSHLNPKKFEFLTFSPKDGISPLKGIEREETSVKKSPSFIKNRQKIKNSPEKSSPQKSSPQRIERTKTNGEPLAEREGPKPVIKRQFTFPLHNHKPTEQDININKDKSVSKAYLPNPEFRKTESQRQERDLSQKRLPRTNPQDFKVTPQKLSKFNLNSSVRGLNTEMQRELMIPSDAIGNTANQSRQAHNVSPRNLKILNSGKSRTPNKFPSPLPPHKSPLHGQPVQKGLGLSFKPRVSAPPCRPKVGTNIPLPSCLQK